MLIAKEKPKPKGEPEMKMAEFIESVKQSEKDTCNWYASRTIGLYELRNDIRDAAEEGYLEDVFAEEPNGDTMRVRCEDGTVYVTKRDMLEFRSVANKPRRLSYMRAMSPYERTRAMVYATGNKWAIENFNAVH